MNTLGEEPMDIMDGALLSLLQRELTGANANVEHSSASAQPSGSRAMKRTNASGSGGNKRASGGRRAKDAFEKQVHQMEQEIARLASQTVHLEAQKQALTDNLQMLELHCKATGHYVQLMQEGEQQAKAAASLQQQTRSLQQSQGQGNSDQGMDWHQLCGLFGMQDGPGTSAYGRPGGNSRDGRGGMAGGADAQQCPRLSLESVPISDHPNEAWLAAMRSATVDDFANVASEFVAVAGPLVLQAEAHGGLTQALSQLCLYVTKYMEFSNVLAIANSRTLYEAIEVDLQTRTPQNPPHGFWANVAGVMRCSPEQIQQVQAAMRSYTTSLSAISDERMMLSKELSATIQNSEAAAKALGQGCGGAVEQATSANELQQRLAKRLSGNIQRQVLCHSMLRVYHTRKVFTPIQIAKAIICSWPFVANVPSIWAAIIESPNPSPRDPSFPPIGFPPTHTGRTGLGGPSPNDPAAAAAAAVVAPLASFPSASSLATLPEATLAEEGSIRGGQRLANMALADSSIHMKQQQQQQRLFSGVPTAQPCPNTQGMPLASQQEFGSLPSSRGGSAHNGQQFFASAPPAAMQQQQLQQQQQPHTMGGTGSAQGSAHGGQQFFATPFSTSAAAAAAVASPAAQQPHTMGGGAGSAHGSAHNGQQFFVSSPAMQPQQQGHTTRGTGSAHNGQHFFSAPTPNAAAQQQAHTLDGGSAHGGQHFFASPAAAQQPAVREGSAQSFPANVQPHTIGGAHVSQHLIAQQQSQTMSGAGNVHVGQHLIAQQQPHAMGSTGSAHLIAQQQQPLAMGGTGSAHGGMQFFNPHANLLTNPPFSNQQPASREGSQHGGHQFLFRQ